MNKFRSILTAIVCYFCVAIAAHAGPVNINTADAETLAKELTGVGPALAKAIVDDRTKNGKYESPEALMRVSGIGERIVEDNRKNILVADAPKEG